MLSTFLLVLPVFGIILAGWLARTIGVLGPAATSEINRFVVYLALPALLFDVVASADIEAIWQPGFIGAFGLASFAVYAGTVFLRRRVSVPLADAAVDGLAAGYANTAYIGLPLLLAVFGDAGLAPTLIASILTICLIFAVAIIVIEVGLQHGDHPGAIARTVIMRVMRNPIVLAPLFGAFFPLSGFSMPTPLARSVELLANAAAPSALVALGLFLASSRIDARGMVADNARHTRPGVVAQLVALKLIVQPALTWLLATQVFRLSPFLTNTAVLIAALPTGTGPFMLAEFYRREAKLTAQVILVSTLLSVATVTAFITVAL
ncbi:transporter [Novosphingobium sp. PC22D]|uniref:AEC family transporter n=1 Tax=Novosphingobium sp. PC22D TaxID=1962403 RepID=UPI000BEF9ACD|nr:AEC family transporter [Novosphingobium sp. PC22D]PEQ11998.1 transporter [Novosphingobium sp. PC22D]